MTLLQRRVERLEAIQPEKESSLAHLTDEELDAEIFTCCEKVFANGGEPDLRVALYNISCRKLFNSDPWVRDANHRIDVFNKFIKAALDQKLPKKILAVFKLGQRNVPVSPKDIELTVKALHDADLGEETPWLKEYLENSGVVSEYHQYQYRSINDN